MVFTKADFWLTILNVHTEIHVENKINFWTTVALVNTFFQGMIDHRSYVHSLSSCEIKARKNSGFESGSNP